EHNPHSEDVCACGIGRRTVQCEDCLFYEASCPDCFVARHRCMPLHWALVWDSTLGFSRRHDISTLRPKGYAIQLGHTNGICPNAAEAIKFTITHSNGIHGTLVSFCRCLHSDQSRVNQLMQSKLFPGSSTEPVSAYSFAVLRQYDLHSLQAKIGAYDYTQGLRRLTDNVFTHLVNDPYQAFMRVARVWRYMLARIRLGQEHGIDACFPHLPPGTLTVRCPACSDPNVNMRGEWWLAKRFLRHLAQIRVTLDGNHQINQFWKNTDPFDRSLFDGYSYFPEATKYHAFLLEKGAISSEEYAGHCNHVKVIANQARIQNQNCAKSGGVNTQCDHVFVLATADMQNGEKFANVDTSLHQAFERVGFGDNKMDKHRKEIPVRLSYDSNCSFTPHIGDRFATSTYLQDQQELVIRFEIGIPDLHIKGHKDDCIVKYGHPYHWCVGHFHGETAEYYWVELNQVGAFTRQMNDGHREDTIIAHHMDWNWRKTVNLADRLAQDLDFARLQYQQKREQLRQLSQANLNRARQWSQLSHMPEEVVIDKKKHWISVYHRRPQKIPSVQALLDQIGARPTVSSSVEADPMSVEAFFKKAQEIREIKRRNKKNPDGISVVDSHELNARSSHLNKALKDLRTRQSEVMPQLLPLMTSTSSGRVLDPEDECLFLPSDISAADRVKYNLSTLALQEVSLREAQANEEICKVKSVCRSIGTMLLFRTKNIKGQDRKTRSEHAIANVFVKRDRHITAYNHARTTLIRLGHVNPSDPNSPFPLLRPEDTHRLDVDVKRWTGDLKRKDGLLWTLRAASDLLAGVEPDEDLPVGLDQDLVPVPLITPTKLTQRETRNLSCRSTPGKKRQGRKTRVSVPLKISKDSWLWSKGTRATIDQKALEEWEEEGDRVQWMRAEAEMYRWMEQFELKHAEFERTILFFRRTSNAWLSLANPALSPGHGTFAKRQAAVYNDLAKDAELRYKAVGHPAFIELPEDTILAQRVEEWRMQQLSWMKDMVSHWSRDPCST
ncbi:hypothetical protein K435DRAFT_659064, partial [Dendrothele bispora CBS 962.96]